MNDINKIMNDYYLETTDLPSSIKEEILKTNKILMLKLLYLMYELLDSSNSQESVHKAYEVLIKSFLFCKSFDIVRIYFIIISR